LLLAERFLELLFCLRPKGTETLCET